MGIFTKNTEQAQAAVTKAAAVVADWEAKAVAARAEAARLDAESGAAILEDESAAERITLNVQAQERKARAFDGAAVEARQKLQLAQRDALEVEAREEDKEAAAQRKKAEAHAAKVASLLAELEKLDECEWTRAPLTDSVNGATTGNQAGVEHVLTVEAERHETRAAVIRYFIATGNTPNDFHDLNRVLGTSFTAFLRSIRDQDNIPGSVRAARDAGLSFAQ